MSNQAFIDKIGPQATRAMHKTNVLASLTIAQAILESNWGKVAPGNMLFGIKAGSSWKGSTQKLWTHEFIKGVKTKVQATFRAYASWYDSLLDHGSLLTGNARYKDVVGCKDYKRACKAIQAAGYATDPKYADKLISLIEKYDLTRFDRGGEDVGLSKVHANVLKKEFLEPALKNAKTSSYVTHLKNLIRAVDEATVKS